MPKIEHLSLIPLSLLYVPARCQTTLELIRSRFFGSALTSLFIPLYSY